LGNVLVQWRWRRCTHACVTAAGVHYLLQPRAKFNVLRTIVAWRDYAFGEEHRKQGVHSPERLQFVMLNCWKKWTTYASKRVIWNKYLFQYRRTEMRRILRPILHKWLAYAQRKRSSIGDMSDESDLEDNEIDGGGPPEDPAIAEARRWTTRLQQAAACLRGLQEGAVPEDRLDERAMRDMLVQIDDTETKKSNMMNGGDGKGKEEENEEEDKGDENENTSSSGDETNSDDGSCTDDDEEEEEEEEDDDGVRPLLLFGGGNPD
jgi:hypothetical protein